MRRFCSEAFGSMSEENSKEDSLFFVAPAGTSAQVRKRASDRCASAPVGQEQAVLMDRWRPGDIHDVFKVADALLRVMDDLYKGVSASISKQKTTIAKSSLYLNELNIQGVVIKKTGSTFLSALGKPTPRCGAPSDALSQATSAIASCRDMNLSPIVLMVALMRLPEILWT